MDLDGRQLYQLLSTPQCTYVRGDTPSYLPFLLMSVYGLNDCPYFYGSDLFDPLGTNTPSAFAFYWNWACEVRDCFREGDPFPPSTLKVLQNTAFRSKQQALLRE